MTNSTKKNTAFIVLVFVFVFLSIAVCIISNVKHQQRRVFGDLIKSSTASISHGIDTTHSAIRESNGVLEIDLDKLPTKSIARTIAKYQVHRIKIWEHPGGKALNIKHLKETVYAVLHRLPNVRANHHAVNMIIETYMVETDLGAAKYDYSAKYWKNYGIGQMREDTAKYLLKTLMIKDTKTYNAVMRYYNRRLSVKDNLLKNIPFNIAMTAQYYILRGVNISAPSTVAERARFWKKEWNTVKGVGTVEKYTAKVNRYRSNIEI